MQYEVKQESWRIEELMKSMNAKCFDVCVKDASASDLTIQEVECIDRCAYRYLQVNKIYYHSLSKAQNTQVDKGGKKK
jgi:predicted metal-binding protein